MVVKVTKPEINVREKISELDKPSGVAGEAMLRAETPQEQFNLIGAGRRNLLINGAMQVAQRGTSFTGLANSPAYTVDRFEFRRINAWSTGRFAVTQEADGPEGFASSIKLATTTAETDTSSIASISTRIEGQDCQSLKYGSSSAESVTLSFWVKSFQTGTYSFALNVKNLNQATYGTLYTINQSNTWEYKTITIPAPALAATTLINNDAEQGLELLWHFTYRDSAGTLTNNSWDETTGTGAIRWDSVNGQTINGSTSTSNYLQITGVQLELGKVATPFEHRSYGEELALCQRYYYQDDTTNHFLRSFYASATGDWYEDYPLPVVMRGTPTWTSQLGSDVLRVNAVSIFGRTAKSGYVRFTVSSTGQGYCSFNTVTADAEL